jgi:SAM-dependent methyltransferase
MLRCQVCSGSSLERIGTKSGRFAHRDFELYRCRGCGYAFVSDPWLDHEAIYSEDYYSGRGADPLVDYISEWNHPSTAIRQYEWRGVLTLVESLHPLSRETAWLDFGAGIGGLVRYVRERRDVRMFGYEPGSPVRFSSEAVPYLTTAEVDRGAHLFDIVTAIEVLEHTAEPLKELSRIRSLLKPGGLFFYTTGNAEAHRNALLSWPYFIPEIHISLYEPRTLDVALQRTGFRPEFRGFLPGFTDIIRFKALKSLGVRHIAWWEEIVPWPVVARAIDRRVGVSAQPIAWAI